MIVEEYDKKEFFDKSIKMLEKDYGNNFANDFKDLYIKQQQEIERLKKREQECIDHYLVQCKYASEMEEKYITANNIINELEKDVKERIDFYKQEIKEFQDDLFTSNYEEIEDAKNEIKIRRCHIIELEYTLDKIEELKGSDE